MSNKIDHLIQRIYDEWENIEKSSQRTLEGWQKFQNSHYDSLYLDAVALNLHNFYNGIERILEIIATVIDKKIPEGDKWHQNLLQQMTKEISGIRPAVISINSYEYLNEYRRFRHLVRNIYAFELDADRLKVLIEKLPELMLKLQP